MLYKLDTIVCDCDFVTTKKILYNKYTVKVENLTVKMHPTYCEGGSSNQQNSKLSPNNL